MKWRRQKLSAIFYQCVSDSSPAPQRTQLHRGAHLSLLSPGMPELLLTSQRLRATRGMSTTILPRLLKCQTTTSHSWPAANHTQHLTLLGNAATDASERRSPWHRESIWTLPAGKMRCNAGVLQGPRELTRNHTVMDSQNGLGYLMII